MKPWKINDMKTANDIVSLQQKVTVRHETTLHTGNGNI